MALKGKAKADYRKGYMEKRRAGLTRAEVGLTEYHPILDALTDPIRRKKLEAICLALKRRGLGGMVYYGLKEPLDFLMIGDLLEATA